MNSKRFYWIKLRTDFFFSEKIDFLMSQKNGANYVVLYQMLCAKTANNNGILASNLSEIIIPFDVDKIVRDCKYFAKDTVMVALDLYKKLGLIFEDKNGMLAITDIKEMIGSESESASRVRAFRDKKALQCNNNVTKMLQQSNENVTPFVTENVTQNVTQEIEIEKDIELDRRVMDVNNIKNNILDNARTHAHEEEEGLKPDYYLTERVDYYKDKFSTFFKYQKEPKYISIADKVIVALVELERSVDIGILSFKNYTYTPEQVYGLLKAIDNEFFIKLCSTISLKGNIENINTYVWGILFNHFWGDKKSE